MRVAVHEPRDHAAAGGIDPLIRGRPRPLDGGDALALDHEGRVAHEPERPLADHRVGRDEETDVVDH